MIKTNLNQKKKATIIGLGVAIPLVIFAATVFALPKTVTYTGSQLISPENIEYRAEVSEKILIGTVTNVEVKPVTSYLYGNVTRGEPAVQEMQDLYQFVTVKVERYLVDKTGAFPQQVTFRDYVSGCYDVLEKNCVVAENSIEYKVGEKVLVMLANVEGDLSSLGYVSTYKLTSEGKFQNQYSIDEGIPAKSLVDIEQTVKQAVEKQKARQQQQSQ